MEHHEVLVVGGGNAGVSLAARLLRDGLKDVAVVECETVHRYRPLLNYVGAGEATMASLERPAAAVVPSGCAWIRDRVVGVDLPESAVLTELGRRIGWSTLVVCTGLEEDWGATPGLAEAYEAGWAGSSFVVESAPRVWPSLRTLSQGRVVFTVPPEPAPCGATAFKPLFMACDYWQRRGVLQDLEVHVIVPGPTPLGVQSADRTIERALASYGVRMMRETRMSGVSDRSLELVTPYGTRRLDEVAYAHAVPHYRAPAWIGTDGLAGDGPAGLVDVDPTTLRHHRHPSVWSLGDVADLRTRPSGGALRKQVDVLAHNLVVGDDGPMRRYDGYTVMPITTARHRLMLVEVDRDGRRVPTVPHLDLTRPRRATWWFDRYALPVTYFRRILRGKV